jgi:V8-like Glu-specific endopeptidase
MPGNVPGYQHGFGIDLPYPRSLCAITSDFGLDASGMIRRRQGTGFLFHTQDNHSYVLTAGHNLYRHELGRSTSGIRLWFGRAGGDWMAERTQEGFRVPEAFVNAPAATAQDDYGVIQVALLDPADFLAIGLRNDAPNALRARLSSYPNEGQAHGTFQPYHGDIDLIPAGPGNFGYVAKPSYEGQSGGPLFLPPVGNGPWQACGIHIRGQNDPRAIRFTEQIFNQLGEWLPD